MTFAQQEPSAKAPCTRTMVLIAMILLLVSKACRLNVAVVHAGHYRTGTTVRPVKQSTRWHPTEMNAPAEAFRCQAFAKEIAAELRAKLARGGAQIDHFWQSRLCAHKIAKSVTTT